VCLISPEKLLYIRVCAMWRSEQIEEHVSVERRAVPYILGTSAPESGP
jgi:hypothetical protein